MRFLSLIALFALVAVSAAFRHGGTKASQVQLKQLQTAAPAVHVNGTLPALNLTTANTTVAITTGAIAIEDSSTTEASSTTVAEGSTTVGAKA